MSEQAERLREPRWTVENRSCLRYAARLPGDEKDQAQVFCDRLLQAFGTRATRRPASNIEENLSPSVFSPSCRPN